MIEDILNLKLCDRLANVYDLKNASLDFIEKYSVETLVILNYLTFNHFLTSTQRKIIEEINLEINKLRDTLILKRVKEIQEGQVKKISCKSNLFYSLTKS